MPKPAISFAACWVLVGLTLSAAAQGIPNQKEAEKNDKTAGAVRRGEKLPGELTDLLDADGDGKISDAEAGQAVGEFKKKAKAKGAPGATALKFLDKNGDGRVDDNEAAAAVAAGRAQAGGAGERVAFLFDRLDADGNEFLTPNEFAAIVEALGPLGQLIKPKLEQLFVRLDQNRDMAISYVESQLFAEYLDQQTAIRQRRQEERKNAALWARAQQIFAAADGNRDKRISKREAKGPLQEKFASIDADLNGKLTLIELYRFMVANVK